MMLIVGAGVAGLSCALAAAAAGADVELVTPGVLGAGQADGAVPGRLAEPRPSDAELATLRALGGGNTALAQGGIAAAIGAGDLPELHAADTVAAGVGLVDHVAAEVLTTQGAQAVRELIASGFPVDRTSDGAPALGLEAAHGRARIVHAGEDRTGAGLHAFLTQQVLALVAAGRLRLTERTSMVSLLTDAGAVSGAMLRGASGALVAARADAVVLATGGYAALYPRTSNHIGARGDGIVLAARAGALVADLEFVQFHPTVLARTGFLVSEAVRGAGAVLRDGRGERFMMRAHPAAELAPRDVVSRTIHRELRTSGDDAVWLDATGIERSEGSGTLARRFPSITAATTALGFDWAREPVPVAPAAHYAMGGIVTDLDGRSTVPGLFAAGETAATGVHGANRLASNSLLEGLVFGARAARAAADYARATGARSAAWQHRGADLHAMIANARDIALAGQSTETLGGLPGADAASVADAVGASVAKGLGIERDAAGIRAVADTCQALPGAHAELAVMIAAAAEARTESRGAHQRADHPTTDPAQAVRHAWAVRSTAAPAAVAHAAAKPATPHRSLAAC